MTSTRNDLKARMARRRSVLEHALDLANRGDRLFVSMAEGLAGSAIAALSTARSSRRLEPQLERSLRLDLVSADSAEPWSPLTSGARVRGERGSEPSRAGASEPEPEVGHAAGVVPLLRALGQIVAEHRSASYSTLERDERFWTLLSLLQTLDHRGQRQPAGNDDDRA